MASRQDRFGWIIFVAWLAYAALVVGGLSGALWLLWWLLEGLIHG